MKKSQIIGLLIIAVTIGIIITTFDDASAYVSFSEAKERFEAGDENEIHVVGELKKDAHGEIVGMVYDPVIDPNYFSFQLIDDNGLEQTVIYFGNKPHDLEKSEKVVIIGGYKSNEDFVAKQILLKCPSKYAEDEIQVNTPEE